MIEVILQALNVVNLELNICLKSKRIKPITSQLATDLLPAISVLQGTSFK